MQPGKTVAIRQAYSLKVVMILKPIFFSFGDIKLVLILGGRNDGGHSTRTESGRYYLRELKENHILAVSVNKRLKSKDKKIKKTQLMILQKWINALTQ